MNETEKIIMNFGRNLCAERNRKGLSQEGLGELISMDARHVSRIECGVVNPKLTTIRSILKALKIPFEALCPTDEE